MSRYKPSVINLKICNLSMDNLARRLDGAVSLRAYRFALFITSLSKYHGTSDHLYTSTLDLVKPAKVVLIAYKSVSNRMSYTCKTMYLNVSRSFTYVHI